MHACIHSYIHTWMHTYTHACIHTYIRTYVRYNGQRYIDVTIHTYIHTYMINTYQKPYALIQRTCPLLADLGPSLSCNPLSQDVEFDTPVGRATRKTMYWQGVLITVFRCLQALAAPCLAFSLWVRIHVFRLSRSSHVCMFVRVSARACV